MTTTIPTGTIAHLDPHTLQVSQNVRGEAEATLDDGFVESIAANGVIVPIVATRDTTGCVHVRYGQRRTLAAQKAGLASVPVYVVDADVTDDAQRIVEQLVENDQRQALTEGDRIQAWKVLEIEGITAAQIAKRTGTKRDAIKTGLAVASNPTGLRLVHEVGMTLDHAAALLEFDDDPETVSDLVEIASSQPDYFPHAVVRARQDREREATRATVAAQEEAKGHRVLPEWPESGTAPWALRFLTTAEGQPVDQEDIEGKEGVAVHIQVWRGGEDGYRLTYYIDNPEALGFTLSPTATATPSSSTATTLTPEEQKEARKALIANNKDWDASEVVRREWLTTFFARKDLPKDATLITATLLTSARHQVSAAMSSGNSLAADLLGIQRDDRWSADAFANHLANHPNKAAHVALAVVIAGAESSTNRETWRHPKSETARYLQILDNWGYNLSPVEKIAAQITDS